MEAFLKTKGIERSNDEIGDMFLKGDTCELPVIRDPDDFGRRTSSCPLVDFVHSSGSVQGNDNDIKMLCVMTVSVLWIPFYIYKLGYTGNGVPDLFIFSIAVCVDQCSH